jgi:glycosyltransferase involved in cell wall biosynthesis
VENAMKIAYLTYGIGSKAMGLGKYSWYLVEGLRKLGVDVDVYSTSFHRKGVGAPVFFFKNAFLNLKKYDLVHSSEGSGLFVSHSYMVETYHHYYKQTFNVNSLIFSYLENIQCRKAKRIIVPSFKTKEDLVREGFSEDKIDVIHHGVDSDLFKPDQALRNFIRNKYGLVNSFVVISVGRLVYHKRHVDIIEALSRVPDSVFVLVGAGEEEEQIKVKALEFGVRLLHFKGVSDEFLVGLYNSADVYAHASILEGFGLTILEAMACSLPVVCYDVADLRRVVSGAGHLLQPGDTGGMTSALLSIKDDASNRHVLSEMALNQSRAFTWEKTAVEHLNVYRKILTSS